MHTTFLYYLDLAKGPRRYNTYLCCLQASFALCRIGSPIHLIAAQSHRGIWEYAQAPECCNVKTGHLGLDLGQKLSKLSFKDHCSRDPVQVQSLHGGDYKEVCTSIVAQVAPQVVAKCSAYMHVSEQHLRACNCHLTAVACRHTPWYTWS